MSLRGLTLAGLGVLALAGPASAQIIATSIPLEGGSGPGGGAEKRFALHLMASPLSKWTYNEVATGATLNAAGDTLLIDTGVFSGKPNSDMLLAGEAVFKLSDSWNVAVGGWYNKVGNVTYDFDIQTIGIDIGSGDFIEDLDHLTGTLDGDLTVFEGHAAIFYKNFGVQGGIVNTKSEITNSNIETGNVPANIGEPLGSIEGSNTANDWDLYSVYKFGGSGDHPWGVSLGAGIYVKKGTTESSQRLSESQTVPTAFVTASFNIFKGLGIDASYWYVGKTKASRGEQAFVSSDAASRLTFGIGYTFTR